jgi:hypothetical protein
VFRSDLERHLDLLSGQVFGAGETVLTFVDEDATPDVAGGDVFLEANTGGATSITAFPSGAQGQRITIIFSTGNTTLVDAAGLQLAGGANFVASANDVIVLIFSGAVWYEVSRSVN